MRDFLEKLKHADWVWLSAYLTFSIIHGLLFLETHECEWLIFGSFWTLLTAAEIVKALTKSRK